MKKALLLLSIFFSAIGIGQIGMQQWRIHFSAFSAVGIAEDNSRIYMACTNGIIEYDTDDNSVSFLTVTNGLSDLGISTINSNGQAIFVGYSNGNIDIIEGNTITNVPWIKLAEIAGAKSVNSVYFNGDEAYISTSIGLIVFDLAKMEIRDTYYPYANPIVYDATIFKDTFYLATENGIYYADKNSGFLNDQAQWSKKTDLPFGVLNGPFSQVETWGENLVFAYDSDVYNQDTIYYLKDGQLNYYENYPLTVVDINADDDRLLASLFTNVHIIDENMEISDIIYSYQEGIPAPKGCVFSHGSYWISDGFEGLVKGNKSIFKNTPYANGSYRMDIQYGKVLVAGGGLTHNFQNNYYRNGVYLFDNEEWTNFNHLSQDSMDFNQGWDYTCVAVNPVNTDELAFGSLSYGGLKVVRDGKTISEVYRDYNSALESKNGLYVIGDLKYDESGNLWSVSQALEPLKVMAPDGTWYSFSLGSGAKDKYPYRLMIDNDGNKWCAISNVGLFVFNDNGTLADQSDDQLQFLSSTEGYGNLPSSAVKAIAADLDGEIWIGTDEGLVVLYSTNNLYDGGYGEYDANPILIEVDGEVEKLLGDTYITSIAIDGGNRKWIGTNTSGVFCLSPDGMEEVYRFTSENSPLISNSILDIKVDHFSGEVFFATDKGLVSFRSDASIFDEEFSDVKVFPNPVTPEFSGSITIQGLGYESDVKITDVAGNLVYKTTSNGGTAIWDGRTLSGDRVQSGVYLVWSGVSGGNKGKNVAKILFIN